MVLVTFPVAMMKYPHKSNLRKEGEVFGGSWLEGTVRCVREVRAAGHIAPVVRKHRAGSVLPSSHSPFYVLQDPSAGVVPPSFRADLATPLTY